MENIIYNELLIRGFHVDVGVVEHSERSENGKVVRNKYNTFGIIKYPFWTK